MIFGKKRKEIEHLKALRAEAIDDAAYWYMQGDHKEYLHAIHKAVDINDQLIVRRRKLF